MGRSPAQTIETHLFDAAYRPWQNPTMATAGINLLLHFMLYGRADRRVAFHV